MNYWEDAQASYGVTLLRLQWAGSQERGSRDLPQHKRNMSHNLYHQRYRRSLIVLHSNHTGKGEWILLQGHKLSVRESRKRGRSAHGVCERIAVLHQELGSGRECVLLTST